MDEQFVPIEGYPNYVISNYGRIVNIKRDTDLTPSRSNERGWYFVQLCVDGYKDKWYVHRLVARAFFLHYEEGVEVSLLSEDKSDCSVGNIHITQQLSRKRESHG